MKKLILQRHDIYSHYYKDFSDGKFYEVSAFDVDPITNKIVNKAFKDSDFSKRKEIKDEFKNPRFIETI